MLPLLLALLAPPAVDSASPPRGVAERVALSAERRLRYTQHQVWTSALRLLRVDRGWSIEDRDPEAGYIMFQEPADDPTEQASRLSGSLELMAIGEDPSPMMVRARMRNAGTHAAFSLLGALEKKLRQDFGPPKVASPSRPPKSPKKPKKPAKKK